MSDVLTLASDFIDKMSNPAHGIHVNEDYSLRFASLLESEGFEGLLRREATRLNNKNTLTPNGWLWLLGWARSKDVALDDTLLLDLSEYWSSISMQVSTIEIATRNTIWSRRQRISSLEEFEHPWLAQLLQRCTTVADEDNIETNNIRARNAQNILVALLQVGSDLTLDAATTLLHHRWPGQRALLEFFWRLVDGLDDETQDVWISNVQPPQRP